MTVREAKDIAKDHVRLKENLVKIRKMYGREHLISAADMSASTWASRLRNPGEFTYDELRAIARASGISYTVLTDGVVELQ